MPRIQGLFKSLFFQYIPRRFWVHLMSIHTQRSGQSKCKFQVSREHLESHIFFFLPNDTLLSILQHHGWLRRWCHPLTPGHRKDLMHDDNERRRWILWITGCFVFFFLGVLDLVLDLVICANSKKHPRQTKGNSPKRRWNSKNLVTRRVAALEARRKKNRGEKGGARKGHGQG